MGLFRRIAMFMLLATFGLIIFGYNYITDPGRVRAMAESYLSDLVGGRVEVQSATLSIFEGLRLDDVKVYVDARRASDSLVFSAQSFILRYDVGKIIRGRLEATQIIAQKPHVHLTENLDTHQWNFYRLNRPAQPASAAEPGPPLRLPEVLLRNARVRISEIRDGVTREIGYEGMDGHLTPIGRPGEFKFEIQTHGISGVGPWATGTASIPSGQVYAQLHDFDYARDVSSMMPQEVREFVQRHALSTHIPQLIVSYTPGPPGVPPRFRAELSLNNVSFSVLPEDYQGTLDIDRERSLRAGVSVMRRFYRGAGYLPSAGGATSQRQRRSVADIYSAVPDAISDTYNAPMPSFSDAPGPPNFAEVISAFAEISPIELRQGSGTIVCTDAGVELKNLTGTVESNRFLINGQLVGYNAEAPFKVTLQSLENDKLVIPEHPRFYNALPQLVRDIFAIIHPEGTCTLKIQLERKTPGARPIEQGEVDHLNGRSACIFFPYPLRVTQGKVTFGYDEKTDADYVHIIDVRGQGPPGSANRNGHIQVNGSIGPIRPEIPDPAAMIVVVGADISSEYEVFRALPPPVRQALRLFDADHTGKLPTFHGNFQTNVKHLAGWAWRWTFDTDLHFDDCTGKLAGFPYPVDHMAVDLHVRDGYVDIENASIARGDAALRVDGRVSWGPMQPPDVVPTPQLVTTDVKVTARNVPLDKDLLAALPPDQAAWIKRVGLGGKLDVEGRVFQGLPDPAHPTTPIKPDQVRFDLGLKLHDGTLWPADGTFSLADLSSTVHLTPESLELSDIHARRGNGELTGQGALAWAGGPVDLAMHIKAKDLPMDSGLYALLPADGQKNWDSIQPHGAVDADISWRGQVGDANPAEGKVNAKAPAPSALPPLFSTISPGFYATLQPLKMTCAVSLLPYRLDDVTGTIRISPERIQIDNAVARHGKAALAVTGTGTVSDQSVWHLNLTGKNLELDDDLRKAVPPMLLTMMDSVKFKGNVDFDMPAFVYRTHDSPGDKSAPSAGKANPPTTLPTTPVDIDMDGSVTLNGCSLDAGVPMKDVAGKLTLTAAVRDSKISTLTGKLALSKATAADRELTDISLDIVKPADHQELFLQKMHANLAGGPVAGEVHLTYPDDGPSRYLVSMVVRNANVRALVSDASNDLRGELTASLSLEGNWDAAGQRRGRGDVVVSGKELYHLPLMMGLFQVTNLSLPIATPFKTGTARYSIEGPRVNFENVELRSDTMLMTGTGHLDFKTKQVLMTFSTDNPTGLKVPFVNDFIKNARGELLKITVKGTIQEPKVQTNSFGTFTTTIDQVFKNDGK